MQATKSRQQGQNRRNALRALATHPQFRSWVQTQLARPSDFLVEVRIQSPDGKWWWVPDGGVTQDQIDRCFS